MIHMAESVKDARRIAPTARQLCRDLLQLPIIEVSNRRCPLTLGPLCRILRAIELLVVSHCQRPMTEVLDRYRLESLTVHRLSLVTLSIPLDVHWLQPKIVSIDLSALLYPLR